MGDLRKKVLFRVEREGNYGDDISDFEAIIGNRPTNPSNDNAFLPDMSAISGASDNLLVVNGSNAVSGLTVYQINVPGFIYIQHWRGNWNPSGFLQILVSNTPTSGLWYELMNSNGNGNDHVNNMFPIRPSSSTYIMLRGTVSNEISAGTTDACKKDVFFVPAWGYANYVPFVKQQGVSLSTVLACGGNATFADSLSRIF